MERPLHGVFLLIHELGVLLAGPPGCGKSRLGLELVARGHALVADDCPLFRREGDRLVGAADPAQAGLVHLRGLGLFDVARLYGGAALAEPHVLDLVLILDGDAADPAWDVAPRPQPWCGVMVPTLHCPPWLAASPALMEAVVERQRAAVSGRNPAAPAEPRENG